MRFGINIPNYGGLGYRKEILAIAQAADDLGYVSAWTTDHILMPRSMPKPYGSIVESITTLAYLAGVTHDIMLGTSVIVIPQRDPILLAKQAAAVYELSNGRFILGVGVGWVQGEYERLGANWGDRGAAANEFIEVMQELWTKQAPSHHGQRITFDDALFAPRPDRSGGVPLVVGGASTAALRRAARYADGWQAIHAEPRQIAAGKTILQDLAPNRHIEVSLRAPALIGVCDDHQKPLPVLKGSPEQVAAGIRRYESAGVDHLILEFETDSVDIFIQAMQEFACLAMKTS